MYIDYLFIDPFESKYNGVSQYIQHSLFLLKKEGVSVFCIKKNQYESNENFRFRVADFVSNNSILIIEAPESKFSTKYVKHPKIHIRLHCSKNVGNFFQNIDINYEYLINEQNELNKAFLISSPSLLALKASKNIFKFNNQQVKIYPNPFIFDNFNIENIKSNTNKREIYFIGVGNHLKGVNFLKQLKIPYPIKINFVGDKKLEQFLKKHYPYKYQYIDGITNRDFLEKINVNDIVIILSLFETWSMVASESLNKYTKIICWDSIGIIEYVESLVIPIKAFHIDEFNLALNKEINNIYSYNEIHNYCLSVNERMLYLNNLFIENILNIINSSEQNKFPICHNDNNDILKKIDSICLPPIIPFNYINDRSLKMRIKNKINKLLRNPRLFFYDSNLTPNFVKSILKTNKAIRNLPNMDMKVNINDNYVNRDNRDRDIVDIDMVKKIKGNIIKIAVSNSGFMKFPDKINDTHSPIRAILLIPEREIENISVLIKNLYSQIDFLPLREKELTICSYPDFISYENYIEILKRIDNNNKNRFFQYPNIFIYDLYPNLGKAIRYSNHRASVTQIFPSTCVYDGVFNTEEGEYILSSNTLFHELDYYIIPDSFLIKLRDVVDDYQLIYNERNFFTYHSLYDLSLYIRKIIQYNLPRDLNLFIPVISDSDYKPYLLNMNEKNCNFDILLTIDKSAIEFNNIKNHIQLCDELAKYTSELFVLESIFLKYQNLLVEPNQFKLSQFYKFASQDSFKFKVVYL